ncbi:MAG: carboxypeptidase regulatory-like domain-containing protein, partial [Vicinamibacteria bacterium]
PVLIQQSRDLNLTGLGLPCLGGAAMVPILMDVDLGGASETDLPELAGVSIPGLLVIPGEVGFLNQFFSALLLVSNGAPQGSTLVVSDLDATIELPAGDDQVPGTADDPLEIAETMTGQAFRLPILGVGPDGASGTGDDTDRFAAGQQGQAEFLVEGRREGFHPISFDIEGTLEGLPIGPVPISGSARGGVLVRNPFFNMTFTAPSTVRSGEEFSLFVTVTNISQAIANLVSVTLNQASLAGATILGEATQEIDTLLPGDSEALEFRFRSNQTGQVTASYLRFEGTEGTGDLLFTLGVGERGIPLSPDTIVLPSSVEVLPDDVLFAALRVLGQAWSIATAPAGTIPEGVAFVSKGEVFDHATELAEAGFRVQVGEPMERALQSLAFDWVGTDAVGFEQIVRETSAGREFLNAIGKSMGAPAPITDFHRDVAESFTARPPHVLIGVGDGVGAAPLSWNVRDAVGRVLQVGGPSSLSNAAYIPNGPLGGTDPLASGRGVALLTRLGSSRYEVRWTGTGTGGLDLTVSLPRATGGSSFYVFPGVSIDAGVQGKVEIDLLRSTPTLTLSIDRDGDGFFDEQIVSATAEVLESFGPELLAATVVGPETLSGADPWGRVVALLFDREVRAAEAETPSRYAIEDNQVLGAIRQLSGRLVFLFLRDPVGEIVQRQVVVSGLFDAAGKPMIPSMASLPITSRLVDPGAVVTGRVLRADGAPLAGAQIFYLNFTREGGLFAISVKEIEPDGSYRFDYVRRSPDGPFAMRAIDPSTGSQQQLSTSVRANGEHIVIDLVLLGRGGVTGTIRDLNGDPVPGAQVLVTNQADPSSFSVTETDGAGRYEATGILVGPVAVKAVLGTASGLAAGNIRRAGTFTTIDVTINLDAGRVTGAVFDNDPELGAPTPVPAIEVHYLVPNPGSQFDLVAASGHTATDGTFVFEDVPSGEFRVLAIDRVIGRQTSRSGTLVAGGSVADFDLFFSADEFGVIQGFVKTASGDPAPGAVVTAAGREVTSAADGSFAIANVPLGTHSVRAVDLVSGRSAGTSATLNAPGDIASVLLTFPGAGRIVVTVLDAAGRPLANHAVFRLLGEGCSGSQRFTDSAGVAIFDDVPVPGGSFKSILKEDVAQGSATIQRDGDVAAVTLRFAGFGPVTGTVLDDQGEPAFGATVILDTKRLDLETCSLVRDPFAKLIQTGQDGTFAFHRVPVGAVSVSASSVFFPMPATAKGSLLFDGHALDFTLNLASTTAGELSGTVFLPDGVTPSGAGVSVTTSSTTFPDVTVTTDADGRFVFAKIFPAGTYLLSASDVVTGGVAERMVSLLADQSLTADLRLLGRGAVEVTVLDGAGDPVEEAFVELRRSSFPFDEAAGAITAAAGGVIRFENITEGEFSVTASDSLGRGGRADGVVLGEGETTDVTVSLTQTGTVRATVKSPDGSESIPNAEVRLRQGTTGRLLGSTTSGSAPDSLGRVEFRFVPAGAVLLTATDPVTGRVGEASGKIETEDEAIDLEIRMLGLGSVSGIVTSNGNPVAGATVDLTSRTGLSSALANFDATATTGSGGEFAFQGVPVGSFTLMATVPGLLLTGSVEGSITTDGETLTDIEIALEPSGTVLGSVLRPDGVTPVPGASVALDPQGSLLRSRSSAAGRFRFEFVPVGDFELRAEEGFDAGIAAGTLNEGEELTIDVVFNGTGTVGGTAFDSDGVTPLTTGLVRLSTPAPFARSLTATVALDGTFRFLRIPVGELNLSLSMSGSPLRGNATGIVTHDGETVTIDIQLADAATALGRIVKPDGATPAPNVVVSAKGVGFSLNDLTAADGTFRIEGIPLGAFSVRAEDPASNGLAIASGTAAMNGEEIDLGDLVLDNSPIAVASTSPDGSVPVPPDAPITIRFTDPVAPGSLSGRLSVSDLSNGGNVPGTSIVSADGLEVTFTANAFLPPRSDIQVTVSRNVEDTLGRKLGADFVSTFMTSGAVVTGLVTLGGSPVAGADVTLTFGAESRNTLTDASGRYRFEDVGIGNALVQAVDSASGRAGSTVVSVDPDDRVITANIALAFVGSVSGQVLRFDGTPAGAQLDVLILRGNQAVGLAATDAEGRFLVHNITLGDFTVDVSDPADGDRGRGSGALTTPGETVEVTVQLLGFGSVRLTVRDSLGAILSDAEASLSFNRFGASTSLGAPSREADGSLVFTPVLAGAFTVTARDPSTDLTASRSGTALAGQEVRIELSLEPTGAIFGIIMAPDGVTPVAGADVRLYQGNINTAREAVTSGADGGFRFEELPTSSTYRIDVFVGGQRRARKRNIEIPPNGEAEVNIRLNGLGTVTGQVIPPLGESLSGSVTVDLRSLTPDLGGTFSDDDASGGTYEITGVPVGPFVLSASDRSNGFLGEAAGELTADGETVVVDIQLLDNAFNWSSGGELLHDANDARYRIANRGALHSETNTLFRTDSVQNLEVAVA